jgi:integrase
MTKRLPYTLKQTTRHGKTVWYFRIKDGPRTRLPGEYGSDEFMAAYRAAFAGEKPAAKTKTDPRSLNWLLSQYRESSAYRSLSAATRKQRDNIFKHVTDASGTAPYRAISRKHIVDGRERRAKTPSQARNFLDAMRGLFRWALEAQLVDEDPTLGVKNPRMPKDGGFEAWNDEDVQKYHDHWPLGTKERVWMDVILYTGLRRGDAVLLGRQHVRDGVATIRTGKTGTEVVIPILEPLRRTREAGPTGDMHFIVGDTGKPLTKESFGNMFRRACNEAGVKKSAHGIRKIAATRAADAGATVAELEAMFGWSGGAMASLYTKTADRRRLALRGRGNKSGSE